MKRKGLFKIFYLSVFMIVLPGLLFADLQFDVSGFSPEYNKKINTYLSDNIGSHVSQTSGFLLLENVYGFMIDMNSIHSALSDVIPDTKIEVFSFGFAPTISFAKGTYSTANDANSSFVKGGLSVGGGFRLGIGGGVFSTLTKDFDFIIKGMYLPLEFSGVTLDLYSFGVKTRWRFLEGKSFIWGVSWDGLTTSVGLDYSSVTIHAPFSDFFSSQDIKFGANAQTSPEFSLGIDYSAIKFRASNFSISADVMTNMHILFMNWFLQTGLIVNLYRDQELSFTVQGHIGNTKGGLVISSDRKMNLAIPFLRGGVEIDVIYLGLTIQGHIAYASGLIGGATLAVRIMV